MRPSRVILLAAVLLLLGLGALGIAAITFPAVRRAIPIPELGAATTRPTPTTSPRAASPTPTTSPSLIAGHLEFGSNLVYDNVTIKGGLSNAAGAHDTTFINCRILGVGQIETMRLGDSYGGCHDIKFINCEFARPDGSGNVVVMKPRGSKPEATNGLHDITFEGCHFGTANSAGELGCRLFVVEIQNYVPPGSVASHGFSHIDFTGCVFEAGDTEVLDFAGTQRGYVDGAILDGDSLVKDCLFKGGSKAEADAPWTGCLVLEMVRGVRVEGNTFWKSYTHCVASSTRAAAAAQATNNVITGNVFDFRIENGISQKRPGFSGSAVIEGIGDEFTENRFYLPDDVTPASDLFVVTDGNRSADNSVVR